MKSPDPITQIKFDENLPSMLDPPASEYGVTKESDDLARDIKGVASLKRSQE